MLSHLQLPQRPGPTPFREVVSIAPECTLIRKEMRHKSAILLHIDDKQGRSWKENNIDELALESHQFLLT